MNDASHQPPPAFAYLRDIIVFPVMVTVIIPYFVLYNKNQIFIPDNIIFKLVAVVFFIALLV